MLSKIRKLKSSKSTKTSLSLNKKSNKGSKTHEDSKALDASSHSSIKKILVVEDDIVLEAVLARIFQCIDPNIQYKWVVSADAAEKELKTDHYHLVLADLYLQGEKSGIDLWDSCKVQYPGLRFAFMSGITMEELLVMLGSDRIGPPFLEKPFLVAECKETLQSMLMRA